MAKVYVEFEEPESCLKCPLFYETEGAFSDVCQLLNESDERVNTLKEKFSDCPLKKMEERENKLRQFEEGEIVCIKHYEAIKNFPILKEQVEDWKADHEHNLELMKGLNERIAELEKENEELEKIRSEQVILLESDLTRIERLKSRIEFLGIRIKSLKSQIKGFENDFDYQNKVINKYKEDLKKLRVAYIQASVANVISGTDFESILKSVLNG